MTYQEFLDQKVRVACPNATGVRFPDPGDKSTWRANPPTLSTEEQAIAQGIFAAFDMAAFDAANVPAPDNGKALELSRRDAVRHRIEAKIASLPADQQEVFGDFLKLIDTET